MSTPRNPASERVPDGGFTNMAWPEDPYGSGQTLRRKPRLLAAAVTIRPDDGDQIPPVAFAVVYLRLHRSKPIHTGPGLAFGFRALAALTSAETAELVRLADLDLLRARGLAQIVAGHGMEPDLRALLTATKAQRTGAPQSANEFGRGLRALAAEWPDRRTGRDGAPCFFDLAHDVPEASAIGSSGLIGGRTRRAILLEELAASTGLTLEEPPSIACLAETAAPAPTRRETLERLASHATEHALVCGLITARHLGLYSWDEPLDIPAALETNAAGCFPTQQFRTRARA